MSKLNIEDFNFESNSFLIKGKGKKERMGYLNKKTKDAVLKYYELRKKIKPSNKKDSDAFFISKKGNRLVSRTIRYTIKEAYEIAKIESKGHSVHTLRHTCATILFKGGTDIRTIQEVLGHSQIDTTKIYTHIYDEDVKKSMLKHPLSKFKIKNALEYISEQEVCVNE